MIHDSWWDPVAYDLQDRQATHVDVLEPGCSLGMSEHSGDDSGKEQCHSIVYEVDGEPDEDESDSDSFVLLVEEFFYWYFLNIFLEVVWLHLLLYVF